MNAPPFEADAPYRAEFEARLLALAPASVLDVGCGDGDLLRRLAALGIRAAGIDPNAERVEAIRAAGLDAQVGTAEALAFDDASFDIVTAMYVPHHCADWRQALRQMLRVARCAVLVLDQWYDPSLPSQRVAAAFDAWCKAIDRASGMVHHEPLSAAQLIAGAQGARVSIACSLRPREWPMTEVQSYAERKLETSGAEGSSARIAATAAWLRIRDDAQAHGITDEGAICLTLMKD